MAVRLGADASISNGTEVGTNRYFYRQPENIFFFPVQVSLVKGNGIKELKAEADYAPEATGKVAIVARARDGAARPEFSVTNHPCLLTTLIKF